MTNQSSPDLLRFITCGSVDDGKSTLIGRLLYDSKTLLQDQIERLEADSRRPGLSGNAPDFTLLVDGLEAEREQGITIDVAYRYFATPKRKFIVADSPGHEQYTRNMITAASTADLAVILIDARKGVLTQTRRHAYLAQLIGIRSFVLAITKMDLVAFDRSAFEAATTDFRAFAETIGIANFTAIPICGVDGDNVVIRSERMSWFAGASLLDHLERVVVPALIRSDLPLRLPVQSVSRHGQDFRGFCGMISSGTVSPNDEVRLLPSGKLTRIDRIVMMDGDLEHANAGQSITVTLADAIDCGRGDVIAAADAPPEVAGQFEATIVWLAEEAMLPGRGYLLKLATQTVVATVQEPKYRIDIDTIEYLAAKTLALNEIGVATIATDRPIVFAPYETDRVLGGFILIDRQSNATVAAGMLHFALHRSQNIHWQTIEVTREKHAALKHQQPRVIWLTGLSGAGKSTIANLVERKLHLLNRHTFLLDGDNVRHALNRDLGFTDADRVENIRRVGEVARLMADAGLIVIAAFISPFRAERQMVREMLPPGEFIEVHIDTPLTDAEARDVKGLYKKARAGKLKNFTGIDSPYEPPLDPEVHVDTTKLSAEQAADRIIEFLFRRE